MTFTISLDLTILASIPDKTVFVSEADELTVTSLLQATKPKRKAPTNALRLMKDVSGMTNK
ncbi:MAG: hypothetical protein H7249_02605 [Chitinophagaceae bacterium]|nr:hypothetical protein [Oligoflexus sp.]